MVFVRFRGFFGGGAGGVVLVSLGVFLLLFSFYY